MKKAIQLAIGGLVLASSCAFATTIDNSASGTYFNNGSHVVGGNYYTGNYSGSYARNFFVFDLSGLSGTVTAATFSVYSYYTSLPSAVTYGIYATSLDASVENACGSGCYSTYNGLVSVLEIGTLSVGPSDGSKTLSITLNSDGLTWLTANVGSVVVIGGNIGPQPGIDGAGPGLFYESTYNAANSLDVTTVAAAAPEPATVAMFALGLCAIAVSRHRRFLN